MHSLYSKVGLRILLATHLILVGCASEPAMAPPSRIDITSTALHDPSIGSRADEILLDTLCEVPSKGEIEAMKQLFAEHQAQGNHADVARLHGEGHPEEAVVLMAKWIALSQARSESAKPEIRGDQETYVKRAILIEDQTLDDLASNRIDSAMMLTQTLLASKRWDELVAPAKYLLVNVTESYGPFYPLGLKAAWSIAWSYGARNSGKMDRIHDCVSRATETYWGFFSDESRQFERDYLIYTQR